MVQLYHNRNVNKNSLLFKVDYTSKWGDMQLMAYQMNNSLPTTDEEILSRIAGDSVDYIKELKKTTDTAYLQYLNQKKNNFNINEVMLALVKWNSDFRRTAFLEIKRQRI